MTQKLISLCIPTFNRAPILVRTARATLSLSEFDDSIELVICDNCSSDDTPQTVQNLQKEYPSKTIIYHRNPENVRDLNFYQCLTHGTGIYRKLLNDYTSLTEKGLATMKAAILQYKDEPSCNVFFCGSMMVPKRKKVCVVSNPDELIKYVYHHVTWISNFGVWEKDLKYLENYLDKWTTQIMQVYWMLNLATDKDKTILYNFHKLYGRTPVSDTYRPPYNVFNVLAKNYYDILYSFKDRGLISERTIRRDKTNSLRTFIGWSIRDYLIRKEDTSYITDGAWKICWDLFKTCPYFYFIFIKAGYTSIIRLFKKKKQI